MKAPDFHYLRAASVDEALAALARHGEDAMVLAGGQSLMAMHNLRVARAGVLVDINRIPGLDFIRDADDHVAIGCLARFTALQASAVVRSQLPLMARALPHVAHPAIRNRGTLGGSLALADPAAELPACCLALNATVVADSPSGARQIAAEDFFTGLYETALAPGELLREVRFPKAGARACSHFDELSRRRGDFALAGIAFHGQWRGTTPAGGLARARLALFGVAERPVLARETMALLSQIPLGEVPAGDLHAALDRDAEPLDDPTCPAAYRRQALRVLVTRMAAALTAGGA